MTFTRVIGAAALAACALANPSEKRDTEMSCADSGTSYTYGNKEWCCPGLFYNTTGPDYAYCCIGSNGILPIPMFSDCWPDCANTATTTTTADSCQTSLYVTDSSYSAIVSSIFAGSSVEVTTTTTKSASTTKHSSTKSMSMTMSSSHSAASSSKSSSAESRSSASTSVASSTSASTSASASSTTSTTAKSSTSSLVSTDTAGSAAQITAMPMAAMLVAGGLFAAAM